MAPTYRGARARGILAAAVEAGTEPVIVSAVKRLTNDPRMERVWKYLQRKRREDYQRTSEYEHSIRDLGSDGPFPSSFPTRAMDAAPRLGDVLLRLYDWWSN